jgi:signal transduction histidine kinase
MGVVVPSITRDVIDRLAEHRTLNAACRADLEWLAAHGSLRKLNTGDVLSRKGQNVEALYIVLSGRLVLFVDRGGGPSKAIEWRGGDVTGVLPYSRLVTPPGDVIAQEPVEILAIPREQFGAMTRECHEVTPILVHTMLDRARLFTSNDLHNEKMVSLGKLSAGLAHELNNPASAIERCAAMLEDRIKDSEDAACELAAAELTLDQIAVIEAFRTACLPKRDCIALSPLERCDREEAMSEWLSEHGLDVANAHLLADTGVTFESLEMLVTKVERTSVEAVLRWAAAGCGARNLTGMIQESAMRISSLLTAIKGFTHMDQAHMAEPVELGRSLEHTMMVLRAKACEKSVVVTLDLEEDLPKVRGFAGELNQVWGNLIDNALDAVAHGGRVEVHAIRDGHRVVVRVRDDGPGIPAEVRNRIFDPFFSTKPQGQGTGLGLDIVRRLVRHNDGAIEFDSRPGQTEFRVSLRIAKAE